MLKVSVVVPVYNPGSNMDDLVRTLLEQSLPAGEFEAIFVDDGSTDGTGERLDALAAEHPHFHVEHIPNSGWPGRPRNVGIDRARGEYLYFVDNDDYLAPRALERLHERAERDAADVVIGKVVGHGKQVSRTLFEEDRTGVTLDWPPLLGLLSPHKLFRRSFVAEHGIRFPEGRTRLEDHLFVVHAYFHTDRISVLTGRPVYHWARREDGNVSFGMDAQVYCDAIRAVLDLVEEHTEPGERRDRLLVHWLRGKILGRMGAANLLNRPEPTRTELHREMRDIAVHRLPERLDPLLPAALRARAAVLRQGTLEDLLAIAAWEARLEPDVRPEVTTRGDALDLALSATLIADGETLRFQGGRWVPPPALAGLIPEGTDLDGALDRAHVDVFVRHATRKTEHTIPTETRAAFDHGVMRMRANATIDPETAGDGGRALRAGRWKARAEIEIAGFRARTRPLAELRVAKRG